MSNGMCEDLEFRLRSDRALGWRAESRCRFQRLRDSVATLGPFLSDVCVKRRGNQHRHSTAKKGRSGRDRKMTFCFSTYAATLDCDKMLTRLLTNSGRVRTLRNSTSRDVCETASLPSRRTPTVEGL